MTEREPNNSFSNATPFTLGTAVTGNLSSITDIDYYSVNLVPGTISIDFDAPGNFSASVFNLDTRFLQGGSLQTLANFHTGKDNSTTNSARYIPNGDEFPPQGQTISTAGEYYFAVYHFDDGGSQTNYDGRTYSFTINQITTSNTAPVANSDVATTTRGANRTHEPVIINIGSNDNDIDGDELTTSGLTNPSRGFVTYTDNIGAPDTVSYTVVRNGAAGTDSFIYQVTDGNGGVDTATVTVNIVDDNVYENESFSNPFLFGGNENRSGADDIFLDRSAVGFTASTTDIDYYKLNLSAGTLGIQFFPPPNSAPSANSHSISVRDSNDVELNRIETGRDTSFTTNISIRGDYYIRVEDASIHLGSAYTLLPTLTNGTFQNIVPVATNDTATVATGQRTTINIGANDTDGNNDELTTTGVINPLQGSVFYNNNIGTSDTATYTPFSNASGTDSFTYQVSDGKGGTDTATVTVSFQNFAPIANNDTANVIGGGGNVIEIGANDTDRNNDELTTTGLTNPSKGNVVYNNNVGFADTVTYTPFANVTGTDSFTYQVSDGKGGTDTATVTVTLNTPPTAVDDTASATAGQSVTINIGNNDNDADGDRLATSGFTNPTQGRVDYVNNIFSADQVIYTAFGSASGTDSFIYQVDDGRGGTDTARVTVNFTNLDVPGDRTTTETIQVGDFVTSNHTANDFADFYSFEAIAGKTYLASIEGVSTNAGTMTDPLVAIYDTTGQQVLLFDDDSGVGLNGSLISEVYVSGTYYLASISTSDNDFSTGTYKLSLDEINTIPIALDDTAFVDAGDTVRINIGLNDTDGNAEDFLSSSGLTQPSKGTVTYSPDSIAGINTTFYDFVDYTANPGASGTDSFIYQVSDGKGGTDTATVTVNINSSVTTTSSPGAEVYRFFNTDNEKHFYTKDEFEANSILQNLPQYRLDGPAFKVANPENGPVVDVYRLYNTQSGTHLFTIDTNERDTVLATLDNFVYEGIAYQAHNEPLADTLPLYRFFHTETGNHFYTTNEEERLDIELTQSPPYNSEGIKWYVDAPTPIPTLFAPPEDQPVTLLGGMLPDQSLIGGGDGGA